MGRYKFVIGITLLTLVVLESIYFLWRENYFKPDFERTTQALESRITSLEVNNKNNSNLQQVDANQLIAQSQSTGTASEESKSAVVQSSASSIVKQPQTVIGKININTASAAELDKLPGIGATIAQSIIAYRTSHGGFKSIEEIKNVNRIGDATFNKFKDQITI